MSLKIDQLELDSSLDAIYCKGLGSQTGFFGSVFFPKSQKPLAVLQVIFFFYLNAYAFQICKNIWPKSNEGVRFGIRYMGI